jgi:hypothetical protein
VLRIRKYVSTGLTYVDLKHEHGDAETTVEQSLLTIIRKKKKIRKQVMWGCMDKETGKISDACSTKQDAEDVKFSYEKVVKGVFTW